MSSVFSNIGSWLGQNNNLLGKVLPAAATGISTLANWHANQEIQRKQQFVNDLITNPQKFNTFVSQFEKPLSTGLTTEVGRQAQAFGAERGLSSSPTVMQDVFAQSLAPWQQNAQQMAINEALSALGILQRNPTTPTDLTSLLKMLSMPGVSKSGIPPIQVAGGSSPIGGSGGYGGWVGPIEDAPTGDSGITGTVPGQDSSSSPFDFLSLINNGALAGA